jgi:hypothetical protein
MNNFFVSKSIHKKNSKKTVLNLKSETVIIVPEVWTFKPLSTVQMFMAKEQNVLDMFQK